MTDLAIGGYLAYSAISLEEAETIACGPGQVIRVRKRSLETRRGFKAMRNLVKFFGQLSMGRYVIDYILTRPLGLARCTGFREDMVPLIWLIYVMASVTRQVKWVIRRHFVARFLSFVHFYNCCITGNCAPLNFIGFCLTPGVTESLNLGDRVPLITAWYVKLFSLTYSP